MKFVFERRYHLLLFLISFLILTRFNFDPDLGWHLAYGRWFFERGEIIRADPFSWTMPGYIWDNSYFFYQTFVYFLFTKIGYLVLALVFGLLATTTILILIWRSGLNLARLLLILLATLAVTVNLGIRPHTVSFLMFSLLLVFCGKKLFSRLQSLPLWFAFFALWANLHRGFVVGLITLGAYLAIDYFWKKAKRLRVKWQPRVGIFSSALLGSLITPSGLFIWRSGVIGDLTSFENIFTIAEWQSVVIYFPINLLYAFLGIGFIYIFIANFKKAEPAWFLIGAFLFALPILAVNFVFYFAAIFIFLAGRYFDLSFDLKINRLIAAPAVLALLAIVLAIAANFIEGLGLSFSFQNRLIQDKYPVRAVEFMKKESQGTNLFNEYAWGGYLDYFGGSQVFIDGRMASWRSEKGAILGDYLAILKGDCQLASSYQIKTVLLRSETKASCFDGYRVAFNDGQAKVLVRDAQFVQKLNR